MLEIQRIRNEKEAVLLGLKKRNIDASQTIDKVLLIDQEWRSNKTEIDKLSSELNLLARTIGEFFKSGKVAEANELKEETTALKVKESLLKTKVDEIHDISLILYSNKAIKC